MDLRKYQDLPVLGNLLFSDPNSGRFAWFFLAIALVFTAVLFLDRGPKVAVLAGGSVVALAVPEVLPEESYDLAVVLRLLAIIYFVAVWIAILTLFPDAPTFFEGNW